MTSGVSKASLREPIALYRYFDSAGSLLYIGISIDAVRRLAQHTIRSSWAERIASVEIERFATRREALDAERHAIIQEQPLHNQQRYGGQAPGAARAWLPSGFMSRDHAERVAQYVHEHPERRYYELPMAARLLALMPQDLPPLVVAPTSGEYRFSRNDILILADRLVRARWGSLPPLALGFRLSENIAIGDGIGAPPPPSRPSCLGDVFRSPRKRHGQVVEVRL